MRQRIEAPCHVGTVHAWAGATGGEGGAGNRQFRGHRLFAFGQRALQRAHLGQFLDGAGQPWTHLGVDGAVLRQGQRHVKQ